MELTKIKWQILFKTNCLVPRNTNNYSICNFEIMAIAEEDQGKALIVIKELILLSVGKYSTTVINRILQCITFNVISQSLATKPMKPTIFEPFL